MNSPPFFCLASTDHALRESAAALLGKMMRDRLVGREVEIATAKFLPPKFQIDMKESPAAAVAEFEGEHRCQYLSELSEKFTKKKRPCSL